MTDKIDVKGDNAHPLYKWAFENYGKSAVPKWNFHKILTVSYTHLTLPTNREV